MALFNGTEDNDIYGGGSGNDILNGLGGDDTLNGGGGPDQVNGGDGDDDLKGGGGNDTLAGDAGADILAGGGGDDFLVGGTGNDRLAGGAGADTLEGGAGDDTYRVVASDAGSVDTYFDSDGEDEIDATRVTELLLASDFSGYGSGIDAIRGDEDQLLTLAGDGSALNWDFTDIDLVDVALIRGAGGNDVITGSAGDDTIKSVAGADVLSGGAGDDDLTGGGGADQLHGDDGDDVLKGGGGSDALYGGDGDDLLIGGAGNDFLDGGDGSDTYRILANDPFGEANILSDSGTGGEDVLDASRITGLVLGATFSGAAAGLDVLRGNAADALEIDGAGGAVIWNFGGMTFEHVGAISASSEDDQVTGSESDDLIRGLGGNDELLGGGGGDDLVGGGGNDVLDGGDGDDALKGGGGQDELAGGAGDDLLIGGAGNDLLDGGEGSDTYRVMEGDDFGGDTFADSGSEGTDVLDAARVGELQLGASFSAAGTGLDAILGNADDGLEIVSDDSAVDWDFGGMQFEYVDSITGSGAADEIFGSDNADVIKGLGGDDYIRGGKGADDINGAGGDDLLKGDDGADVVKGGAGDDQLFGGAGADVLTGANGDDWLDGGTGLDNLKGGGGNDTLVYEADGGNYDGQDGADTLSLSGSNGVTLDLDAGVAETLVDIEIIDLAGGGNVLVLDRNAVRDLSESTNTLVVMGHENDVVLSSHEWTQGENIEGYHVFTSGVATLHVQIGVDVTGINTEADEAPFVLTNAGAELEESTTVVLTPAMLTGVDADQDADGVTFTITDLPDYGTLSLDGTALETGQSFTQADVAAGLVTYESTTDDGAQYADSFGFDLSGGPGNDVISDTFEISIIGTFEGTEGEDALVGGTGDDIISGGAANDFLRGGAGDDHVLGGDGDDVLRGGADDDILDGGAGNDRVTYFDAVSGVSVNLELQGEYQDTGGEGVDKLISIESLSGGQFNDTFIGDDNNNFLWGSGGDDHLEGGDGDDLFWGDGFATLGDDYVNGGAGTDTMSYEDNNNEQRTEGVFVTLAGGYGGTLSGGETDTLVSIENVEGTVYGDEIIGNDGANVLSGGGGNDWINGWEGSDTLHGGDGDDTLLAAFQSVYGDAGVSNSLFGGAGNDYLNGGVGADLLDGGDGDDRAAYFGFISGVTVNLELQGSAQDTGAAGLDTLVGIENLSGTLHDDTLIGDDGNNWLWGGGGEDTLVGGAGDDILWSDGHDLYGGVANDILDGGDGTDTVNYWDNSYRTEGVDVRLYDGSGGKLSGGEDDVLIDIENVIGTQHGDIIYGDDANNVLDGYAGDDILLYGGDGDDTIYGGDGHDWALVGGQGSDTIHGGEGNDFLFGASGVPHEYTDTGGDALYGGAGNDYLNGGVGDDWLDGGDGEDRAAYYFVEGSVTVNLDIDGAQDTGAGGTDTLVSIENVSGTSYGDTLTGDEGDNWLWGIGGADTLNGGAGNDELQGDGEFNGDYHNDIMDGGDGIDTVSYWDNGTRLEGVNVNLDEGTGGTTAGGEDDVLINIENVIGTQHDDTIFGSEVDNRLEGAEGNDFLRGEAGADELLGGEGDDILRGGAGNDFLDGGEGDDRVSYFGSGSVTVNLNLQGEAQDTGDGMDTLIGIENLSGGEYGDTLIGDEGNNWLWGNAGNDNLYGGAGDDLFWGDGLGMPGDDFIDGGDGIDTLSYFDNGERTGGVTVSLQAGDGGATAGGESDTLVNIENLEGTQYGDDLDGDGDANALFGGGGDDDLYGAAGDDVLQGGTGADDLLGDSGLDTADYSDMDVSVTVNLVDGYVYGGAAGDTFSSIENLTGGSGSDVLTGNNQVNVLDGGDGDDDLDGDVAGDTLYGGAGNDVLDGGDGLDTLWGGTGDDSFLLDSASVSADTLADFEGAGAVGGDVILIDNSVFDDVGSEGTLGAGLFASGAGMITAPNTTVRFFYDTTTGNLYYDKDGSDAGFGQSHIATLTGSPDDLDENDFLVI